MQFNRTIANIFIGCCFSTFILEILMTKAPYTANLITFFQFLFVSLQGFVLTSKFGRVKPKIPLKQYALLVALFFVTNVGNNYVYALHVPPTLHTIVRSISSPASMLVSWLVKKRSPKLSKLIGSILISVGVAVATYGDAKVAEQNEGTFFYWCVGVVLLLTLAFTGAFTGLQQEILYAKYGKHPEEMMFYSYALPLPLFIGIYPQLRDVAVDLSWEIWILIFINVVSQFYCAHSVHELAAKEMSVTVTFILTLRKFVSLLVSTIAFKNNVTLLHIIGAAFVMIGTYIYFDFFVNLKQRPVSYVKSDLKNK